MIKQQCDKDAGKQYTIYEKNGQNKLKKMLTKYKNIIESQVTKQNSNKKK